MLISLLVAASKNNVIGKNNQLLWHLPNDMKFFRNITWGMPVIMGRKTLESLHNKALNGRINIVLTKQKELKNVSGKIELARRIEDAIALAKNTDCKEVFVIGGGEIFKSFLDIANRIYLTRVEAEFEGDTYFPEFDKNNWTLSSSNSFPADEKHKYPYTFETWDRNKNSK
jgi:dihydrofolate reductase